MIQSTQDPIPSSWATLSGHGSRNWSKVNAKTPGSPKPKSFAQETHTLSSLKTTDDDCLDFCSLAWFFLGQIYLKTVFSCPHVAIKIHGQSLAMYWQSNTICKSIIKKPKSDCKHINFLPKDTLCILEPAQSQWHWQSLGNAVQPNPALTHVPNDEGSQWPSAEHSWPPMRHPCCWNVWHTQCHLSPKRSVGHSAYGASTLWLSRAVCWRVGCLNTEQLSNKCSVHRTGK